MSTTAKLSSFHKIPLAWHQDMDSGKLRLCPELWLPLVRDCSHEKSNFDSDAISITALCSVWIVGTSIIALFASLIKIIAFKKAFYISKVLLWKCQS